MPRLKRCFKCLRKKARHLFYAHPQMNDGLLGKCKACAKRDVRENYKKRRTRYRAYERERNKRPGRKAQQARRHQKLRVAHPGKARCWNAVANAIRDGRLKRQPCEGCGVKKVEAHHDDYRRPLVVRWLCKKCHRRHHNG